MSRCSLFLDLHGCAGRSEGGPCSHASAIKLLLWWVQRGWIGDGRGGPAIGSGWENLWRQAGRQTGCDCLYRARRFADKGRGFCGAKSGASIRYAAGGPLHTERGEAESGVERERVCVCAWAALAEQEARVGRALAVINDGAGVARGQRAREFGPAGGLWAPTVPL
ncbi:hypothetical protein BDW02DRAFT_201751 [Decorospora gaudefroyi]|uniref:Uncharacterized protein n=1 Tax=Decorospora gaudefroyi TaxID=184978 RepID=A0A6A5KM31_9PLEO|nr:hypothetical protein BDW02DRAFT_201751 [Decorospora gaudefroyi]